MRRRGPAGEDDNVLMDEDEQRRIVESLEAEGAKINAMARHTFAGVSVIISGLMVWCSFCFFMRSPRALGKAFAWELEHQTFLLSLLPSAAFRLVMTYIANIIVALFSTRVCLGKAPFGFTPRLCMIVFSVFPLLLWLRPLLHYRLPLPYCWLFLTAPANQLLALYIDHSLKDMSKEISRVDSLRYNYKSV